MKLFLLVLKNLRRNPLRSALTVMAVVLLVAIFSMIATVLRFLDKAMAQKSTDIPLVITERFRIPSRFDRGDFDKIVHSGGETRSELDKVQGFHAEQHNIWHFVLFTTDLERKQKDLQFLVIATFPDKIKSMIDSMEELDPRLCDLMKTPPRSKKENAGILVGPDRLARINKKVGDVFKAISPSHYTGDGTRKPLEMEFEIVGELPGDSRWSQGAFMDYAYLDRTLNQVKSEMDGKINLGWLKVDDQQSATEVGGIVEHDIRNVKCESASSAASRFLDSYKDLLYGVKYILSPAIVLVMTIIVANAISITVRERTAEMAVLKVLGFRPSQILALVLGEGLLLGLVSGFLGAVLTYTIVNHVYGGLKTPIAFFSVFFVPPQVFWWGPVIGAGAALLGGIFPALAARGVKVSEVFSKVT